MFNKYTIFISARSNDVSLDNVEKYSTYRQVKIKKSETIQQKQLNIQTEQLLLYGLKHLGKQINIDSEILTTKQGKPYFKDHSLFFNISHSHNYIVVAIGDNDVGVDIEKIDLKRMKIAPKIFNNELLSKLDNNIDLLIKTWTIKESYIKLFDLSVLVNLKNIIINDDKISSKYGNAYFKTYKIDNYYLSLTTKRRAKIVVHSVVL